MSSVPAEDESPIMSEIEQQLQELAIERENLRLRREEIEALGKDLLIRQKEIEAQKSNTDSQQRRSEQPGENVWLATTVRDLSGFEPAATGCEATSQPAATSELFAKPGAAPEATATKSRDFGAYEKLIEYSLRVGDIVLANTALNEALELDPTNIRILADHKKLQYVQNFLAEAEVAYAKNDFRKVVYCMARCCEVSTMCTAFKQRQAEGLMFIERFQEAQEIAHGILQIDKLNVDAIYVRGMCFYHQDSVDQALANFEEVFRLAPNYKKSLDIYKVCARIMKSFLIFGDTSKVKYVLNKVLVHSPNNSETQAVIKDLEILEESLSKAEAARAKNEFCEVIRCMDRCCDISPSCPAFKLQKAEGLTFLRKFHEAQEIADGVLRMDKKNADAIYVRGMCLYYQRNLKQAVADFGAVLRLAPDHTKALDAYTRANALKQKNEKGNVAFEGRKYFKALSLYSEALFVDPLNIAINAKLHYNRAKVYAKLMEFDESLEDCTQALELDGDYLDALLQRAACHMHFEDYEEAMFDYEKACEISNREDIMKLLQKAEFALRKRRKKNYYKILGIDKNASPADIKTAYRNKVKLHHPDKHSTASESTREAQERKFKEVNEAHRILSDPIHRQRYHIGCTSFLPR